MKPLILFLGAGASAIKGFPTVDHFFERLETQPGSGFQAACQEIVRVLDVLEGTSELRNWPICNAEKVFGRLEEMAKVEEFPNADITIRIPNAIGPGVRPSDLIAHLKRELVRLYGSPPPMSPPPPVSNPPFVELFEFVNRTIPEADPLRIFTTNYDTIVEDLVHSGLGVESAFEPYQPKLCTGFSADRPGIWNPSVFGESPEPRERLVHLIKLHGSVNWKYRNGRSEFVETGWSEPTGEYDCVLYFGYKSVPETEPFKTFHTELKKALLAKVIVLVIGFRFEDPYIREIFDFALRANPDLRIICCLQSTPLEGTAMRDLMTTFGGRFVLLRTAEGDPVCFGAKGFLDAFMSQVQNLK